MTAYDVVVLGAGVIGLSTALELVSRGYNVAVVAKDLPCDLHSTGFASPWAGANWCSYAEDDKQQQEWDRVSYAAFLELAQQRPDLCELLPFYETWANKGDKTDAPWYKDVVRDFKVLKNAKAVPGPDELGIAYKSFCLHAPRYLDYLSQSLKGAGVPFVRARLTSIDEAFNLLDLGEVGVVVNATGLGARSLLGVEDKAVLPIRGQTVLVRAPDVKTCIMRLDEPFSHGPDGPHASEPVYIIPRPGPEETVILGGSFQPNNFETHPDYELAERILQRTYELCPQLAGPNGRSWRDIEIVSHNVGFRPGRSSGPRLELEERRVGAKHPLAPKWLHGECQKRGAVVHAYGLGPAGYQASVGVAKHASDLVEGHLKKAVFHAARL